MPSRASAVLKPYHPGRAQLLQYGPCAVQGKHLLWCASSREGAARGVRKAACTTSETRALKEARRPGRVATITQLIVTNEKQNAYAERPELQEWCDEDKHRTFIFRSTQVAVHM